MREEDVYLPLSFWMEEKKGFDWYRITHENPCLIFNEEEEKADLLGYGGKPKPTAQVSRSHDSLIPKNKLKTDTGVTDVHFHVGSVTHSKGVKIGIVLAIIGIAVSIIIAFVR